MKHLISILNIKTLVPPNMSAILLQVTMFNNGFPYDV